jgi:hypothetical protein
MTSIPYASPSPMNALPAAFNAKLAPPPPTPPQFQHLSAVKELTLAPPFQQLAAPLAPTTRIEFQRSRPEIQTLVPGQIVNPPTQYPLYERCAACTTHCQHTAEVRSGPVGCQRLSLIPEPCSGNAKYPGMRAAVQSLFTWTMYR